MSNRRRKKTQVNLSTGNDPSLWRYEGVCNALKSNLGSIAALINADRQPIINANTVQNLSQAHTEVDLIVDHAISTDVIDFSLMQDAA